MDRCVGGVVDRLGEVDRGLDVAPLHLRHQFRCPPPPRIVVRGNSGILSLCHAPPTGWQSLLVIVHVMDGNSNLPDVVLAGGGALCLAGCLHRRKQEAEKSADDLDHDEKLDQGEGQARRMGLNHRESPKIAEE
jgi:hypothetical protein